MRDTDRNYFADAQQDARDTALNYLDTIVQALLETSLVSDDLHNDYPDGDEYQHIYHVDRYYRLIDAVEVLEQLSGYKETDSGLWDGLDPAEAISCQAAYTYGAAVLDQFRDLVQCINTDAEYGIIGDMLDEDNPDVTNDKRADMIRARVREIIREW